MGSDLGLCDWVLMDGSYCEAQATQELDAPYCGPHATQRATPCEHGLDYQLCAGPNHYPSDS